MHTCQNHCKVAETKSTPNSQNTEEYRQLALIPLLEIKALMKAKISLVSAFVTCTLAFSSTPGHALEGFESICSLDESCAVQQSTLVAYKNGDNVVYKTLNGGFLCSPATFDIKSPASGISSSTSDAVSQGVPLAGDVHCYAMIGSTTSSISSSSSGPDLKSEGTRLASGTFAIVALSSGKALALSGLESGEDIRVVQQNFRQLPGQVWQLTALDNGYYSIIQPDTQLALEIKDWDTRDGAKLHNTPWINSWNQHWAFEEVEKGVYQIRSRFSGNALDVYEMDKKHNADIVLWTYWGGENQHWRLVPIAQPVEGTQPTAAVLDSE